jgi:hypothetical protein
MVVNSSTVWPNKIAKILCPQRTGVKIAVSLGLMAGVERGMWVVVLPNKREHDASRSGDGGRNGDADANAEV